MNRTEHLQWAKDRALEILEKENNIANAVASFVSDMRKHDELVNHVGLHMMAMKMFSGQLDTPQQVTEFINGFN